MPLAPCPDRPRDDEPGGFFADALEKHAVGTPVTCTGCEMLTIGCRIAEQASLNGRGAWCALYPLRRSAYFAETAAKRRARAAHAGIFAPPEP
jgi:hypothetical protein